MTPDETIGTPNADLRAENCRLSRTVDAFYEDIGKLRAEVGRLTANLEVAVKAKFLADLQVGELIGERGRLKKCLEEVWLGMDEFLGVLRGVIPQSSLDMWEAACKKMRAYTEKRFCLVCKDTEIKEGVVCEAC